MCWLRRPFGVVVRTGLDVDVRRSADALGLDRGGRAELKALRPGDFFAVGPAVGSDGVVQVRAGAVETRHPEPGGLEVTAESVPPPPEELRATLAALASLEADGGTTGQGTGGAGERQAREALRRAEARAERAEGEAARLHRTLDEALSAAVALRDLLVDFRHQRGAGGAQQAAEAATAAFPEPSPPPVILPETVVGTGEGPDGEAPTAAHRRILAALRLFEALGVPAPEKANVAVWAGYRPTSGSFSSHLATMKRAGWVTYPGGRLALTATGRAAVPAPEAPATTDALRAAWLAKLSEPQGKLLRALLDAYPAAVEKDALAEATGYSAGSGSFSSHLAALRALGAVEYPAPGEARVSGLLFPAT